MGRWTFNYQYYETRDLYISSNGIKFLPAALHLVVKSLGGGVLHGRESVCLGGYLFKTSPATQAEYFIPNMVSFIWSD